MVEGELVPGKEIGIRIDHTLLQDATGTMAMLEFMAMGVTRVKVELAAFASATQETLIDAAGKNGASGPNGGKAEQVVDNLKKRGVPVKLVMFSDEGHGWRKTPNRIRSTIEVTRWFVKYLGQEKVAKLN